MLERLTVWLAGERAEDLIPSHFSFNAGLSLYVCVALLLLLSAGIAAYYLRRLAGMAWPMRTFLVALRTASVALAVFLALDPSIVAKRVIPGEQVVVLLFDDSQSMRIVGQDSLSRGERLLSAYETAGEAFENTLKRKHQVARYRLGASIQPLPQFRALTFAERESDLVGGIRSALTDLEGTNVSAVVLFSDGVQQASENQWGLADLPVSVPVYTVGVEGASRWSDIEIASISVKRTEFDKSPAVLTVNLASSGLSGRQATIEVVMRNRVVKSKTIHIDEDAQEHEVRLEFIPDRQGWLEYEARVRLEDDGTIGVETPGESGTRVVGVADRIKENNSRGFVLDNRQKDYGIIYVSGRPSWENKFISRALSEDKALRMTSLIAISNAKPKFVFRGRESSSMNTLFEGFDEDQDRPRYDEAVIVSIGADSKELRAFPSDARDLFGYHLVVLGEVEREFFTMAQLEVIRDFVEKRGGVLLLLGDARTISEGNYAGTPIESMLPFVLHEKHVDRGSRRTEEPFSVSPTMEGSLTGAWTFDSDLRENAIKWDEMPELFGLDLFPLVRVGATVMAKVDSTDSELNNRPLFAVQRYGEGKTAIFATGDTWQWQMRRDHEDMRHERLWRQIVRNLVYETPEPSMLRGKKDAYTQGVPVDFEFVIRDGLYEQQEGLQTVLALTTPAAEEVALSVDESIQEAGLYTGRFAPEQSGLHRISFTAVNDKDEIAATIDEAFLVEPDRREFLRAEYDGRFLRDVSEATGGKVYSLDSLDALARAVPVPMRMDAEDVLLHLWHLPGFYLALVLMLATEWYLRRKRGYA